MKVLHLISGGDTGGAKTHVHTLLAGLTPRIQVKMVCFTEGPFTQEARALGASYGEKCAHIFSVVDSHLPIQDFRWKSPHNPPWKSETAPAVP